MKEKALIINLNKEGLGLCNKFFYLFSACDICIKNDLKLIEPFLGGKNTFLFSHLYDLDYFNNNIKQYNKNNDLIVSYNNKENYEIIINNHDLWQYSENILKKQRNNNIYESDCMNILVLKSLKLSNKYQDIINLYIKDYNINNINGIHLRVENDWKQYNNIKKCILPKNEILMIEPERLINLYKKYFNNNDIIFTTGENHEKLKNIINNKNINNNYFFDSNLNYEINASINFEIMCNTKNFLGLSRSTYSNLITIKRHLMNKNRSYIYNLNNKIFERIDLGLHPIAIDSISKKVKII
jgi:hypothetical protein